MRYEAAGERCRQGEDAPELVLELAARRLGVDLVHEEKREVHRDQTHPDEVGASSNKRIPKHQRGAPK